jgi:hypothetical protein
LPYTTTTTVNNNQAFLVHHHIPYGCNRYVPEKIPKLTPEEMKAWRALPFAQVRRFEELSECAKLARG